MSEPLLQSQRAVHVGGLAEDISESTIRAAFIPFGPIQSIDIPMDYAKGHHKGFCFIEYQDADDAAECIFNMDGSELMGKVLMVNLAQATQLTQAQGDKAVWSTEEWFQQQQAEEKTVEPTDATLKEQGPLVAK
jgi:peptidyl-prolyl isomerase E (cyclophilin E)